MPQKHEDRPYVDNYPALRDWLREHNGRCNWQAPLGGTRAPYAFVESWTMRGGGEVIVVVRSNKLGWDIYTAERTGKIDATFADAEARLGLTKENLTKEKS